MEMEGRGKREEISSSDGRKEGFAKKKVIKCCATCRFGILFFLQYSQPSI